MLRELLDSLRCPRPHEESWLVAVVHRAHGPRLLDAELACPVCGAEFAVVDGVGVFDDVPLAAPIAVDVMRTAALLGVTEGTLPLLLAGSYGGAGEALAALLPLPQVWINPPDIASHRTTEASALRVRGAVPLGVHTVAAAVVDEAHATPAMLDSLVRAIAVKGRLVAPATVPLPGGVRELARDAQQWVAEVTTRASGLVELRRRDPTGN